MIVNSPSSHEFELKSPSNPGEQLPKEVEVSITTVHGETINFSVSAKEYSIKIKDHNLYSTFQVHQPIYKTEIVTNTNNVSTENNIPSESSMIGFSNNDHGKNYNIFVQSLDGNYLTFRINTNMTVMQLKGMIEGKTQVPAYKQKVVFDSKTLENGDHLYDYNLFEGACLHLILLSSRH